MFHIICRTLWLDQEVTEEKVRIIKPDKVVSTFRTRFEAEEAQKYLTRQTKHGNLSEDIVSISFWVIAGNGEPKENGEENND